MTRRFMVEYQCTYVAEFTKPELPSRGMEDLPPMLDAMTPVIVDEPGGKIKIYLYGGYVPGVGRTYRNMYVYDSDTGSWETKARNAIPGVAATGVYHPPTDSIFYFGGFRMDKEYRVFQYHIKSDMWYYIGDPVDVADLVTDTEDSMRPKNEMWHVQSPYITRSFASGIYAGDDRIIIFGGQTPGSEDVSEPLNTCFSAGIQVFDVGELH
ncbi:hypothetical protein HK102_006738 [Quaeritorhiza haematococci]|nr:hypothetical protein HK102_006738 [Quaeritorhiza haematococci]